MGGQSAHESQLGADKRTHRARARALAEESHLSPAQSLARLLSTPLSALNTQEVADAIAATVDGCSSKSAQDAFTHALAQCEDVCDADASVPASAMIGVETCISCVVLTRPLIERCISVSIRAASVQERGFTGLQCTGMRNIEALAEVREQYRRPLTSSARGAALSDSRRISCPSQSRMCRCGGSISSPR